jgi:hypothetical protein
MNSDIYVLDCKPSGIVAVKPGTQEIIHLGNYKELTVFRNKALLDAALERAGVKEYEYGFKLEDIGFVPYSKAQQISYDYYQTFTEDTIIDIVPTVREKMFMCGYFSFTDNPQERIEDWHEGSEVNIIFHTAVKEACAHLLKSGQFKASYRDYSMYDHGDKPITPIKYDVFNYTLNLRIMRGFELVKINESRSSMKENVLPFICKNDKYKNIYFCFSRDENEFKGDVMYRKKAEEILNKIEGYLLEKHPDLKPSVELVKPCYPIKLY